MLNKLLIKKVSILFFTIGLITLIYELIGVLFFIGPQLIYILTIILLGLCLGLFWYGIKRQNKIMQVVHICITFIISFLSLITAPDNISGVIFISANFLLLDEYGFLKRKIIRNIIIIVYILVLILSVIISKTPIPVLMSIIIIVSFFFCFIKILVTCKETNASQQFKKGIDLIEDLKQENQELRRIIKSQIQDSTFLLNVLEKESKQMSDYIDGL